MMMKQIAVNEEVAGSRLDIFLANALCEQYSRSQIQKLIRDGKVKISPAQLQDVKALDEMPSLTVPHYRIKRGEFIWVETGFEVVDDLRAEDIPLDIIFEDEDLIAVNKPAGMVVHPAHGNPNHTLVNALLYHTKGLSGGGDPFRPGIVHRLDKDTSGLLVIAKNDRAHAYLAHQFKQHTIERSYRVVVQGVVQHDQGICEEPVGRAFLNRKKVIIKPSGGKDATTYYCVAKRFKKATLLEIRPKTGRTHQIRVHMAHLDHPVLGDTLYGVPSPWIRRQALHAFSLGLKHPRTKERCYWECPMPEDMVNLLAQLESES